MDLLQEVGLGSENLMSTKRGGYYSKYFSGWLLKGGFVLSLVYSLFEQRRHARSCV